MKIVAMIAAMGLDPAFEGKFHAQINGKTLISRVYQSSLDTGLFADVIVVTDDSKVAEEIQSMRGSVVLNKPCPDSGLECIAKAAANVEADLIVYILGNIPYVQKTTIERLAEQFDGVMNKGVEAASMVQKIHHADKINDTRCVKALLDLRLSAIYFSRAPIPYIKPQSLPISHYEHFGIYAFRKELLLKFLGWPISPLERAEGIEGLRLIENGVRIKMVINTELNIEINTPADIAVAEELLNKVGWN